MKEIILKYHPYLLLAIFTAFSFFAFLYYFQDGKNLLYADAISRLNIARKVTDNITPGLPQVGNVWLPLPQLIMVPFVASDYFWHTGIAGYIMSGMAYIATGIFIYKTAKILTNSGIAAFFSALIFALNINILYLQTTAMSESIFLAFLSATLYFFIKWFHTRKTSDLLLAAVSVSAMTLIRYEGLAILLPSIPLVFFYEFITEKKKKNAEGKSILYATLACLGFALWTLYLTVIFGNPLFWKDYYATPQATGGAEAAFSQAKPFFSAVWQYFTSVAWMAGIIPTIFAIISIFVMIGVCIKRKSWDFLVLLMPFSIFLFMVLTLQRNTPIVQPVLSLENIASPDTSKGTGFNIRYGLLLLPWVAILSSYLLVWKSKILKGIFFVLLVGVFSFQIYTYFSQSFTLVFKIPDGVKSKPYSDSVGWMKEHYDGGKILISAGSQEDQMFLMGFPYKTFIHEGAGKYWKESLDNPSRYAKWVVIDYGHSSDNVARHMNREDILEREYQLVYQEDQLKIFKKFKKPYYEIN